MIVQDRAFAEEITLDVFMRVWQKAGLYDEGQAKVSAWLTHITRNHAIDVLRRKQIYAALVQLPTNQRQVMILAYFGRFGLLVLLPCRQVVQTGTIFRP